MLLLERQDLSGLALFLVRVIEELKLLLTSWAAFDTLQSQ